MPGEERAAGAGRVARRRGRRRAGQSTFAGAYLTAQGLPPEIVDPPGGRLGRAAPGLVALPACRRGRAALSAGRWVRALPSGRLPFLAAPSGGRQGRPSFSAP
jgi:hypothetical protein